VLSAINGKSCHYFFFLKMSINAALKIQIITAPIGTPTTVRGKAAIRKTIILTIKAMHRMDMTTIPIHFKAGGSPGVGLSGFVWPPVGPGGGGVFMLLFFLLRFLI